MKQLLSWTICALIFVIGTLAQTPEAFDIATFRSPAGWAKQTTETSLLLSTEDKAKGTYCLMTLLTSVPGTSDAKKNFDAAWQTVVKTVVNPTAAPQIFPSSNKEDWKAEGGFAPFEKDGEKGVAVLFTLIGYGKMVNILVLTNTMDYEPTITAFLESVSLKKPETASSRKQQTTVLVLNLRLPNSFGNSLKTAKTSAVMQAIPETPIDSTLKELMNSRG